MTSFCVNCQIYKWPSEGIPLFKCSNCKFLSYCSLQCQKEHWVKLHKKQCKTLAGKVEVPASSHNPDSCPGCKEEQEPSWGHKLSALKTVLPGAVFWVQVLKGSENLATNIPPLLSLRRCSESFLPELSTLCL